MSNKQLKILIILFGSFFLAQVAVWLAFGAYILWLK